MDEREKNLMASRQALVSTVEEFLTYLAQGETGCVWLDDIKKVVESLDVMTPAGALVRKPLSRITGRLV